MCYHCISWESFSLKYLIHFYCLIRSSKEKLFLMKAQHLSFLFLRLTSSVCMGSFVTLAYWLKQAVVIRASFSLSLTISFTIQHFPLWLKEIEFMSRNINWDRVTQWDTSSCDGCFQFIHVKGFVSKLERGGQVFVTLWDKPWCDFAGKKWPQFAAIVA